MKFFPKKKDPNTEDKGSAGPYILAWLLGVPISILLLIAMVRAIFT